MSHWRDTGPLDCKVYVGDLGSGAAKHELERAFETYGPIVNVWVARNPPGFAYVEFQDARDAQDAVRGLDGRRICKKRVRVELAKGKQSGGRGHRGSSGPSRSRYGGGGRYASPPRRYRRSRSRSRSLERRHRRSKRRSRSRSRDRRRRSRSHERRSRSRSRSRSRDRHHSRSSSRDRKSRSCSRDRHERSKSRSRSRSRSHSRPRSRSHSRPHSRSHSRSRSASPRHRSQDDLKREASSPGKGCSPCRDAEPGSENGRDRMADEASPGKEGAGEVPRDQVAE